MNAIVRSVWRIVVAGGILVSLVGCTMSPIASLGGDSAHAAIALSWHITKVVDTVMVVAPPSQSSAASWTEAESLDSMELVSDDSIAVAESGSIVQATAASAPIATGGGVTGGGDRSGWDSAMGDFWQWMLAQFIMAYRADTIIRITAEGI